MKLKQSGIGTIETIVAIAVVVAIVLGGFWILTQDEDEVPVNNNGGTQQPAQQAYKTESWALFDNDIYSLRIPDGWILHQQGSTLSDETQGELAYREGRLAELPQSNQGGGPSGRELYIAPFSPSVQMNCSDPITITDSGIELPDIKATVCYRAADPADEEEFSTVTYYLTRDSDGTGLQARFGVVDEISFLNSEKRGVSEAMLNTLILK